MAKKSPRKNERTGRPSHGEKISPRSRPKVQEPAGTEAEVAVAECAVVGLGASAGGLDAFKKFFERDARRLQHGLRAGPAPGPHPRKPHGRALEPGDAAESGPDRGRDGRRSQPRLHDPAESDPDDPPGRLHLIEPIERRGMRMPIDIFFRSLAEDQQERAIGIILSGTGTEGTLGLKAIKASGGMTIAQDPDSAQYDGMPRSAIAAGVVDQVLPVEGMPAVLLDYVRYWRIRYKTGSPTSERRDFRLPRRRTGAPADPRQVRIQQLQEEHAGAPHSAAHDSQAHRTGFRLPGFAARQPRRD